MSSFDQPASIHLDYGDPTLDTAPIHGAVPAPNHLLPGMLSLLLTGGLLWLLCAVPWFKTLAMRHYTLDGRARRVVDVLFNDFGPKDGPESTHPAPQSTSGSNSGSAKAALDPGLITGGTLLLSHASMPALDTNPEPLPQEYPSRASDVLSPQDLPARVSPRQGVGNGVGNGAGNSSGSGKGPGHTLGTGHGSIKATPVTICTDLETLGPIFRARPMLWVTKDPFHFVKVMIQVNAEGVPILAEAVDGDRSYYAPCCRAALKWRFLMPQRLREQAPIQCWITFAPSE